MRRVVHRIGTAMAAAVVAGLAVPVGASGAQAATTYYVALGDSLATGGGATAGDGYVNDIFANASQSIPGLQLKNLGCGGDSTTRMINGGLCQNYTTGNQLGDAEAFLASHPGQVAFVTIDIGGDDIDGCGISGTINPTCVANALAAVDTNIQIIMTGLRTAGGSVPIVGMNYYDPYLAAWFSGAWFGGPPSQDVARQSLPILRSLNSELATAYAQFGTKVANVQGPFKTTDWAMTGSYRGTTLPLNVANICNWTHMCDTNPGDPNIHPTDYGHSLIAAAYEKVLRVAPTVSGQPPTASTGNPYSFQFTVTGYPAARVTHAGTLPTGLTLSRTGLLSGTPTKGGSYPLTVKASNTSGIASQTVTMTVS